MRVRWCFSGSDSRVLAVVLLDDVGGGESRKQYRSTNRAWLQGKGGATVARASPRPGSGRSCAREVAAVSKQLGGPASRRLVRPRPLTWRGARCSREGARARQDRRRRRRGCSGRPRARAQRCGARGGCVGHRSQAWLRTKRLVVFTLVKKWDVPGLASYTQSDASHGIGAYRKDCRYGMACQRELHAWRMPVGQKAGLAAPARRPGAAEYLAVLFATGFVGWMCLLTCTCADSARADAVPSLPEELNASALEPADPRELAPRDVRACRHDARTGGDTCCLSGSSVSVCVRRPYSELPECRAEYRRDVDCFKFPGAASQALGFGSTHMWHSAHF